MEIKTMKKRCGLVKGKIGTRHNMRCPDGIRRVFTVRDRARLPDVEAKVFCAWCNKFWDTESDMRAEHPENRAMIQQEETHLYMWWSAMPLPNDSDASVVDPKEKVTAKPLAKIDYGKVYGFMSDEEIDLQ